MENSIKYFETKVSYETMTPNGAKKVSESYLVKAMSHADAENKTIENLVDLAENGLQIKSVSKRNISEIHVNQDDGADIWYRARVGIITIDEKSGSEKKVNINLYVQANDFDDASRIVKYMMRGSISDYDVVSIIETKIVDLFA